MQRNRKRRGQPERGQHLNIPLVHLSLPIAIPLLRLNHQYIPKGQPFPVFDRPLVHDESLAHDQPGGGDGLAHKRFEHLVAKGMAASAP